MFFCFVYADYYPAGGMQDYFGKFATLEEAKAAIEKNWKKQVWLPENGEICTVIEGDLKVLCRYNGQKRCVGSRWKKEEQ